MLPSAIATDTDRAASRSAGPYGLLATVDADEPVPSSALNVRPRFERPPLSPRLPQTKERATCFHDKEHVSDTATTRTPERDACALTCFEGWTQLARPVDDSFSALGSRKKTSRRVTDYTDDEALLQASRGRVYTC